MSAGVQWEGVNLALRSAEALAAWRPRTHFVSVSDFYHLTTDIVCAPHATIFRRIAEHGDALRGLQAVGCGGACLERLVDAFLAIAVRSGGATALRVLDLMEVPLSRHLDALLLTKLLRASPCLEHVMLTDCSCTVHLGMLVEAVPNVVTITVQLQAVHDDAVGALCAVLRDYARDETVERVAAQLGAAASRTLARYLCAAPALRTLRFVSCHLSASASDALLRVVANNRSGVFDEHGARVVMPRAGLEIRVE